MRNRLAKENPQLPILAALIGAACGSGDATNEPPYAEILVPELAQAGELVVLDASRSADADGFVVQYRWVFTDGSAEIVTSTASLDHRFPRAGRYDVGVVAVDDDGAETMAGATITITDEPVTTCDDDETACDGRCVDTGTDPEHCGGCNRPCDGECQGGVCAGTPIDCAPPLSLCGGACVNVLVDVNHCGACDTPCSPGGCAGGSCQTLGRGEVLDESSFDVDVVTGLSFRDGRFWLLLDTTTIVELDEGGGFATSFDTATGQTSIGLAVDPFGLIWASDLSAGLAGDLFAYEPGGAVVQTIGDVGGGVTVDDAGDVWTYSNSDQALIHVFSDGSSESFPVVSAPSDLVLTDIAWDSQGGVWGVKPLIAGGEPLLVNIHIVTGMMTEFPVTMDEGWGGCVVAEGFLVVVGQSGSATIVP